MTLAHSPGRVPAALLAPRSLFSDCLAARVTYLRCLEASVHMLRGLTPRDVDGLVSHGLSAWMVVPLGVVQ